MNDFINNISDEAKEKFQKLTGEIKTERDELRVQAHLAKAEAHEEWEELEEKWAHFETKAQHVGHETKEASKEVWAAITLLGEEIKAGYQRIRKSI